MGAFFVYLYAILGFFRKNFINTPFRRITEVCLFSFISASLFFWLSAVCNICYKVDEEADFENYIQFQCPVDYYNPQATLYLNSEGATIRALMNDKVKDTVSNVLSFSMVWYLLMITTQGIFIPAGLFLPGMVVGSGLGFVLKNWLYNFPAINQNPDLGSSYQIMGATAYMAGYTRQTYSLAVIMLETTQTINFFIPIMITVFCSVGFAGIFNRSLYERALRSKQIPMLRNHCPKLSKNVTAF